MTTKNTNQNKDNVNQDKVNAIDSIKDIIADKTGLDKNAIVRNGGICLSTNVNAHTKRGLKGGVKVIPVPHMSQTYGLKQSDIDQIKNQLHKDNTHVFVMATNDQLSNDSISKLKGNAKPFKYYLHNGFVVDSDSAINFLKA